MRSLERNKRTLYYATLIGKEKNLDDDGRFDGTYSVSYDGAYEARMNISPASGQTAYEIFGITEGYTHIIVDTDMECPLDVDSIVWYDRDPKENYYNFVVVRKAKSLNQVFYALKEVQGDQTKGTIGKLLTRRLRWVHTSDGEGYIIYETVD